jgi:hypothetical protein
MDIFLIIQMIGCTLLGGVFGVCLMCLVISGKDREERELFMSERYLITEAEYESLPVETQRHYHYCHLCGGFYNYYRTDRCICQIEELKLITD